MIFYALFSKSQQVYNTPFLAHSDTEAVAIISKTLVAQQDPALIMSLDDLALHRVGRFVSKDAPPVHYIDNGGVDLVLDDLHITLPLPPMIKAQVDKIYSRKEDAMDGAE